VRRYGRNAWRSGRHWPSGNFGGNLRKTVTAFREDRKLPVTGAVDAATWAALSSNKQPLLVPFKQAGRQITVPNVILPPPGEAAQVLVTKGDSSVRTYGVSRAGNPEGVTLPLPNQGRARYPQM
jgi:peptidoglycan hydrolase-like protein with peptidoglycan-binding domain